MYILVQIIGWAITLGITIFVIVSIVLFIKDGIASKKEGRIRNKKFTVMFIVSMVIIGLLIVIGILLSILAMLVMRSM
jgi:hypothetical protein